MESIVGGSGVVDNARGLEVGTKLIEKVGVVALKRCFRTRLMSIMSSSPRSKWLRLRGGFHVAQRNCIAEHYACRKEGLCFLGAPWAELPVSASTGIGWFCAPIPAGKGIADNLVELWVGRLSRESWPWRFRDPLGILAILARPACRCSFGPTSLSSSGYF